MKVVKILLSVILAIIVLVLVVALFLPSEYTVSRSIVIDRSPEMVFAKVANLEEWPGWNPWSEMDTDAQNSFSGAPGEVGSSWSWEGQVVGSGTLTLQRLDPPKLLQSKLEFIKPQQSTALDTWTFEEADGGTKVTWENSGNLDYPMGRIMGLVIEGSFLGPAFEKGLANLKQLCESQPEMMEEPEIQGEME